MWHMRQEFVCPDVPKSCAEPASPVPGSVPEKAVAADTTVIKAEKRHKALIRHPLSQKQITARTAPGFHPGPLWIIDSLLSRRCGL